MARYDVIVEAETDEEYDDDDVSDDDEEYDEEKEEDKSDSEDVAPDEEANMFSKLMHLAELAPSFDNNAREDYPTMSSIVPHTNPRKEVKTITEATSKQNDKVNDGNVGETVKEPEPEKQKEGEEKEMGLKQKEVSGDFTPKGNKDAIYETLGKDHNGRLRGVGGLRLGVTKVYGKECSMGIQSRSNISLPHDLEAITQAIREKLTEEIAEKVTQNVTKSLNVVLSQFGLSEIHQPKLDRPLKDKTSEHNTHKSAPFILVLEVLERIKKPKESKADSPPQQKAGSPPQQNADSPPQQKADSPPQQKADSPPQQNADSPPQQKATTISSSPPKKAISVEELQASKGLSLQENKSKENTSKDTWIEKSMLNALKKLKRKGTHPRWKAMKIVRS
ncbi:hypothetical protein BVRB_9g203820 [Beta vulgaris subsp. vulgaris]|nr:hypothetical protein BVRB_9g203820 [Beta vulgaris subsp. vulgaris]